MIRNQRGTVFGNEDNPFVQDKIDEMLVNAYTVRSDLVNTALHSRKDINKECDYPETLEITVSDFKEMYDRNPIGARVCSVMSDESWQISPDLIEDEDASVTTEFEKSFSKLGKKLYQGDSWYESNEVGNPIWEYLSRVDRLSGIGHFGSIVIGIDDGKNLNEPVDGFLDPEREDKTNPGPVFINNRKQKRELLYLNVFPESSILTMEFENNIHSQRYRRPTFYHIDLGEVNTDYATSGREGRTIKVHWSRVVHVADNMDASEILGIPRQRPVWNALLDLMKVYGGDAEGWWKNCIMRIFLESHPQLGGDVTLDEDTLKERMWDMENGLQRWAALTGLSAKTVAPAVADPTSHINIQIDAICIKIGIPKRIFLGSERGNLASGQDDSTWNDRIRGRRNGYVTPRIIVPFIDRLIQMGVLPEPKKYRIDWPDPETLKPQEKAEVALKRIEVMSKYIGGQVDSLMDPMDLFTRELEIEEEDAKGILERAEEHMEEVEEDKQKKSEEQQEAAKEMGGVPPPPGTPPPPPPPVADDKVADDKVADDKVADKKKEEKKAAKDEDDLTLQHGGGSQKAHGRRGSKGGGGGICPEPCKEVDVLKDSSGDGVTDASRVGVAGDSVPPPPKIGRIANLNERERAVEDAFASAYEKDPDGMASDFRKLVHSETKPGEAKVFGTDDAKALTDAWGGDDLESRSQNRATLNVALHGTANAVAKRAFVQELDTLKPGDEILITVGGVGAGKGYALKNVPEALEAKGRAKAVWDSAGDQNATESPWIQGEANKRGLKTTYVYVHADPKSQWSDPGRGVIKRAGDPSDGRMVDSHVFADSYAIGAKNHSRFQRNNSSNKNANFIFIDNTGVPKRINGIPDSALKHSSADLTSFARKTVQGFNAPDHVKAGGLIGGRIWGEEI